MELEELRAKKAKLIRHVPCRDCEDRTDRCHSECEKYTSWHDEIEQLNEEISNAYDIEAAIKETHEQFWARKKHKKRKSNW